MDSNYVKLQAFVGQIGDLSSLCFCREIQLVQTMLEPAECRRLGSICYYHVQHAFSNTCTIGQVHLLVYIYIYICNRPCENRPCSHLVVIRETAV